MVSQKEKDREVIKKALQEIQAKLDALGAGTESNEREEASMGVVGGFMPQGGKQGEESDQVTAKALKVLSQIGHAPETLNEDDVPGITERDKFQITVRHGKVSAAIVSQVAQLVSLAPTIEQHSNIMYEEGSIDKKLFYRNTLAKRFCQEMASSIVNVLEAEDAHRFEGLQRNVASGKMAHADLENAAEDKRAGRLARLMRFRRGESDGEE